MALFGLIGRDRDPKPGYTYRGREPAGRKAERKRAEKEEKASAARRSGHCRSLYRSAAAGQAWEDAERRRIG